MWDPRVDDLERRVEALERGQRELDQRTVGDVRLGPRPETPEEARAQLKKLSDVLFEPVDRTQVCTTNDRPIEEVRASQTNETGQHEGYIVLCESERAKGFVRPYRDTYKHVGRPETSWSGDDLKRVGGCGTVTKMGRELSETYARDPTFYGATFCCGCNRHLPVAEFVWIADNQQVGL